MCVPDVFTAREQEIIALFGQGMCRKEVARSLGVSCATVAKHKQNISEKAAECGYVWGETLVKVAPRITGVLYAKI